MANLQLLIVDDEPLIRMGIKRVVSSVNWAEIHGECGSGSQAIAAIKARRPDVVLLDVQMPDCSGLDVIRVVGPSEMPAVIFVTAYDEYAVRAFELNAVDYLLKPFTDERLTEALERARARLEGQPKIGLRQQLEALLEADRTTRPQSLVVRQGERSDFVPLESIDWIEAADNYVQLHCGSRTHLMSETLSNLERRLPADQFLRVHRGRIVNVTRVTAAYATFAGAYELELRSGRRIGTGRQYKAAVQRLLKQAG